MRARLTVVMQWLRPRWGAPARLAVEAAGVATIAGAAWTVHEGLALLVAGAYLVLAAHTGRGGSPPS